LWAPRSWRDLAPGATIGESGGSSRGSGLAGYSVHLGAINADYARMDQVIGGATKSRSCLPPVSGGSLHLCDLPGKTTYVR
jgi:hypothetical protein